MADKNADDYETADYSKRERKIQKRIHPRGRRLVQKKLSIQANEDREKSSVAEAKNQIMKVVGGFENQKKGEKEKQKVIYMRWVRDSLQYGSPIIAEGDLHLDSSVASVGAGGQNRQKTNTSVRLTHIPTLISVKNEEERNFEQNRQKAEKILTEKLSRHLDCWKALTNLLPSSYSLSEINRRGEGILSSI